MATRTLGIKFEIAGVKEAKDSLKQLRSNLNKSLEHNKKAIATSLNLSNRLKNNFNYLPQQPATRASQSSTESQLVVRLDRYSLKEIARLGAQDTSSDMPDPLGNIQKKGLIGGTFANVGFSIRSIYKGFLESIGSGLGVDYGEGLKEAFEEDLDLSFKRRGKVTGKTIAYGVSEGGRNIWDEFNNFLDSLRNASKVKQPSPEDADSVVKALTKFLTTIPSTAFTGYRRASVQLEGLPRVEKQQKRKGNEANEYKDKTEKVVYTITGFAGQEGQGGHAIAQDLAKFADDATEVVGLENIFTDLNTNYQKTVQWVIEALATVANINLKGFNPDAIKGAAKIINDLEANPNLKATVLGHSAGGFVSEEITQILNLLGYGDRIRGISAGTPNLKGRIAPDNFTRVMGDRDNKMRKFEQAVDPLGLTENDAQILAGVPDHFFEDYLESEEFLEIVLGNRISALIERYQKYLENLIKQSQKLAKRRMNTLFPGYKNFTLDQKKSSAAELNKYIKTISKNYRQAVKENDLNLAKNLGENLLRQVQFLRQIYKDILKEGGTDRNISSELGTLTKIQQEVIKGQPNLKGYDSKGLVNHFGDQLTGEAGFVVEGFVEGIKEELDRVKEAGEDIGDSVQDGTDDNLGIKSPARKYIEKGIQLVAGFVKGIKDNLSQAREVGEELGDVVQEGTERTTTSNPIKKFFAQIGDRFPLLKKFKGLIAGIATLFLGGLGLRFTINLIDQLGKEALATALELEKIERAIVFISRNPLEGIKNLNFISAQAKNLSVDLQAAKNAYAGLLGAAKNTPLEGVQTKRLFTAFADAAVNRGVDAQGQNRLFTALEQIIAKRRLGAEEVVQQIGDISGFGDFKGLIQQALGVSSAELDKMMRQGEVGIDVLPKIVALIEAQNASADETQTAQQALTKYNNSLVEFKGTLGKLLQPLEKLKLNILADGLDLLTEKLELLFSLIAVTGGVALLAMFGNINLVNLATIAWTKSINFLILSLQKLWAAKFAIIATLTKLALAYGLITTAFLTWKNVIDLSKNQYQDLADGADKMAAGIDRYRQAIRAAAKAQDNFNQSRQEFKLNAGLDISNLPQWLQGIAGGDRLNLDNLVRKRIVAIQDWSVRTNVAINKALGFDAKFSSKRFTTEAERRQADLTVAAGNIIFRTNQLLSENPAADRATEEINEFDRQIREIQAQRLKLLPGDREALEASLAAERAINEERDVQLKVLTTYQQELQNAIAQNKAILATPGINDNTRNFAQSALDAAQTNLKVIDKIISRFTKSLSEFERRLRNSSERIDNYIERRGLQAQAERSSIIIEGLESGKGERVIQLEIDKASRRELKDYISELKKTIEQGRERLQSGALAEGYGLIQDYAQSENLTLDTATLQRILEEERDEGQKNAIRELLKIRESEAKLGQYREQLAQNLQTNRSTLIEFNRSISDYFFRLTQQIKEAQVELKRIINSLFYGDIKTKLKAAITPGSESFLNGIIEGIQGIIDQASSIAEQVLGQESALIGFESQKYDLKNQLQDFARQIAGASDAVVEFSRKLRGDRGTKIQRNNTLTALRRAIIGKESGANFKAVNPHSGALGYGQVMPANVASWTKAALGKSLTPQQFLNNPDDQIKAIDFKLNQYLERELKATGNNLSLAVRRVASTWYSGQPGLYDNARPQTYGAGNYPSIRDYTTDIFKRFNQENGTLAPTNTILDYPESPDTKLSQDTNILQQAQQLNQQRLSLETDKILLEKKQIDQDRDNLGLDIDRTVYSNQRQFNNQEREAQKAAQQISDRLTKIGLDNQLPTAAGELEKSLIDANSQFTDFNNEVIQQLRQLTDFVSTAQRFSKVAPEASAKLRARGTASDLEAADFIDQTLERTNNALPGYLKLIEQIAEVQDSLPEAQAKALKFIAEQGRLKIEQEQLQKQSLLSQLKLNIATARGTNEERRQQERAAEKLRLEQKINEIRQQYVNTDFAEELINQEQENSQINLTKIDNEAINRELTLEQQLISLQSEQASKKANLFNFIGLDLEAGKIQQEAAINSEMLRYKQQIQQLKQSYAGEPEKLKQLLDNAKALNQLNLDNIKIQFKSLGTQLQELSFNNLQGFFNNLFTIFSTGGERQQQILQANLDYADKLNEAHEKFKYNPAELAQTKNRLKELNNQKLDSIREEFNLFNRVVNFAKQAVAEFLKSFAQMMARRAAAGIFRSLGLGLGFKEGGTVPNFAKGGTVADKENRIVPTTTSSFLSRQSQPLKKAFQREGSQGVLAVFTPGEEILSLKTGEAQRYQALKQELGINPLKSLLNFAQGGTVEGNLLRNVSSGIVPRPTFSSNNFRQTTNNINRTGTVNINVTTPDADSFKMSEHQLGLDLAESMRRGMRR